MLLDNDTDTDTDDDDGVASSSPTVARNLLAPEEGTSDGLALVLEMVKVISLGEHNPRCCCFCCCGLQFSTAAAAATVRPRLYFFYTFPSFGILSMLCFIVVVVVVCIYLWLCRLSLES
jgi:hypothetical protein